MAKILFLEDMPEIQIVIKHTFKEHQTTILATLAEARARLAAEDFDFLVLDISLPDGDGLQFCNELKSNPKYSHIPVIILTGKTSIQEKALGFQLGIEDYVVKPFDPLELRFRIESRLKKIEEQKTKEDVLSIGNIKIDLSRQTVTIYGPDSATTVNLSTTEFKILGFLARNLEKVKSREQIISYVWSDGVNVSDRAVDTHISRIRKKMTDSTHDIEAVINTGYRLTEVRSKK